MLAPRWAYRPLDGAGAAKLGGRFNPPGVQALYMSVETATAIAEYEQDLGIRPGTLCAYEVDTDGVLDLRSGDLLERAGVDSAVLSCPWKLIAFANKAIPPTWDLARRLIADDVAGILVPSIQAVGGSNLVLWSWNTSESRRITALDPLEDLPRNADSWKM